MSNFKNIEQLNAYLKSLEDKLSQKQLQYPLNSAGNRIRNIIEESFEYQKDPISDKSWTPLKKSTKMRKLKKGKSDKILRKDGALEDNWEIATTKEVKVFNNSKANKLGYGIVHQFGSSKKKIPARPFLPVNEDGELDKKLEKEVLKIFEDFLQEAIK